MLLDGASLRPRDPCDVAPYQVTPAGHPLKPRTIQLALGELEAAGLAAGSEEGNGRTRYWSPTTPNPGTAVDDDAGDGGEAATHEPVDSSLDRRNP
jgi:hypothetical protein